MKIFLYYGALIRMCLKAIYGPDSFLSREKGERKRGMTPF
jgi:hypothetical protein